MCSIALAGEEECHAYTSSSTLSGEALPISWLPQAVFKSLQRITPGGRPKQAHSVTCARWLGDRWPLRRRSAGWPEEVAELKLCFWLTERHLHTGQIPWRRLMVVGVWEIGGWKPRVEKSCLRNVIVFLTEKKGIKTWVNNKDWDSGERYLHSMPRRLTEREIKPTKWSGWIRLFIDLITMEI